MNWKDLFKYFCITRCEAPITCVPTQDDFVKFHPAADSTPPQISPRASFHGHAGSTPSQIGVLSRSTSSSGSAYFQSRRAQTSLPHPENESHQKIRNSYFLRGGVFWAEGESDARVSLGCRGRLIWSLRFDCARRFAFACPFLSCFHTRPVLVQSCVITQDWTEMG